MADILDTDTEYLQDVADRYDRKKRKFEAKLERRIKRLFREISKDFVVVYSLTGSAQDMEIYRAELEGILMLSYREVSRFFSRHFERELSAIDTEESDSLLILALLAGPIISARLLAFNRIEVPKHAGFILNTTRKVLNKNAGKAAILLSEEVTPTASEIAKEAGNLSRVENANRAAGIAETEVGNSSNGSILIEEEEYDEQIRRSQADKRAIGNRIAQLDEVTRADHLMAHGQQRPPGVPFQVGPDLMLRPLDSSLGAGLSNIAGCRCQLISSFSK